LWRFGWSCGLEAALAASAPNPFPSHRLTFRSSLSTRIPPSPPTCKSLRDTCGLVSPVLRLREKRDTCVKRACGVVDVEHERRQGSASDRRQHGTVDCGRRGVG